MAQTVIGLFDSEKDAQQAAQQLFNDGFTDANVDVNTRYENTERGWNKDHDGSEKDNGIVRFFNNLFGTDEGDKYSKVAERCSSIVTVHAQDQDEAERAADILDLYGAVDVDKKASEFGYSYNTPDYDTERTNIVDSARERFDTDRTNDFDTNYATRSMDVDRVNSDLDMDRKDYVDKDRKNYAAENVDLDARRGLIDNERSIPVIEENINVGKREVETGGIRLRSRIIERPVEENLRLRQERVRVERTPVDREATDADFRTFKEGEIELTERGEVPLVSKEARVVEEVRLRKEVEDRSETVRDSVRKTEVDVDDFRSDDELRRRDNI